MILLADQGVGTEEISRRIGCSSRTVRKWKGRFLVEPCIETLEDRPRSGRPARVPLEARCQLIELACSRPESNGAPAAFRDIWTHESLADALEKRTGCRISTSEVGRILRCENLRPHRVRYWLKSEDPDFLAKAKNVCDLYQNPPEGSIVLCMDEKPLQVLGRKYPTTTDPHDASIRYEYEYLRHGTQSLLAAFNVQTGQVVGRVVEHRDASTLVSFMDDLVSRYPDKTIYIVWDNLNTHYDGPDKRWTSLNAKHGGRLHFVYTPKHASWMNQIEVWFSILHRRILKYGDYASKQAQAKRIRGFIKHWNRYKSHPFRWTWRPKSRRRKHSRAHSSH